MLVTKITTNNAMYNVQELHLYSLYEAFKVHYKSLHFYQYFYYIFLLVNQLLCHMIYYIHNYNY